jgi:hypothetical protein
MARHQQEVRQGMMRVSQRSTSAVPRLSFLNIRAAPSPAQASAARPIPAALSSRLRISVKYALIVVSKCASIGVNSFANATHASCFAEVERNQSNHVAHSRDSEQPTFQWDILQAYRQFESTLLRQ